MRGIKTHFGVIISLVALLFSMQFGFFVNDLIKNYEFVMKNEYNIILVSKKELNKSDINATISEVADLEAISTKPMLKRLESKISKNSLDKLSQTLPKFYSVKLQFFPNNDELKTISEKLEKLDGISRVEVFAKAHDNVYRVLVLMKNLVYIFSFLITVLGLMLMLKQMRIWLYEHKERVEIMTLFGAPFFIKSFVLYKMAIVDSIISTIIVVLFYQFLPNFSFFQETMNIIGVSTQTIVLPEQGAVLFASSLILSLLIVTLVMFGIKRGSGR
ncbi:cell division protein FtsX [Campylobacter geochelonis]|uniref:Cell division protein FtsX n=1 Tax=Campylobacter geochelonis TaxID=1780362 RepID=A0A128EJW8_9BACT|nr:cell division protein FtsX [Campylobacter geochelonis]QKF71699.1 cell division protein FtsX [Campylobacter geochelonis]CZE49200.1 cell division protein FtsX [Campylobacter geochelonis]CZE49220.1 cell division protein FtsX [Campylobacter geochelonis]CZE51316.1 cell division protein FtsX [Campylobacter geochelonis]